MKRIFSATASTTAASSGGFLPLSSTVRRDHSPARTCRRHHTCATFPCHYHHIGNSSYCLVSLSMYHSLRTCHYLLQSESRRQRLRAALRMKRTLRACRRRGMAGMGSRPPGRVSNLYECLPIPSVPIPERTELSVPRLQLSLPSSTRAD